MHRFLASALLLLLPSVAQADARADIVALRHGRETSHQEFLGWTSDGRAVARRLVCSEDGESTCRASIDALAVGAPQHTTVLWSQDQAPDDEDIPQAKSPISTAQATRFIRAERRALEGLGRLSPGTAVADPAGAFGLVGGEPTEIYLRESGHPTQEEALRPHVAVRGPRGVSVDLEQLGNEPWRIEGVQVLDAQLDPEGRAVWVALQYQDGVMCWDGEDIEFTVAERARVRAQLANAAGLRAYRAGELDEAGALWLEATA
ncbi:MAG: hypothetical protein KDK70_36230, partial [Myxococcales bacterium]|nr:hypothetical protein [Myxococcales bacterium]